MFPNEPAYFWMRSKNIEFAFQVMGDGRIVRDATGPRVNIEGAHVSPEASDWERVVSAIMNGRVFRMSAYSAEGRTLVISRILRP